MCSRVTLPEDQVQPAESRFLDLAINLEQYIGNSRAPLKDRQESISHWDVSVVFTLSCVIVSAYSNESLPSLCMRKHTTSIHDYIYGFIPHLPF